METLTTIVTMIRRRNTRVNINSNFRSNIGPRTRNAILADGCIVVKLAATKASASLHRHMATAITIMAKMVKAGYPSDMAWTWSAVGPQTLSDPARQAP